jgi:RNA polymerase sigma-70 factor (ECF subfamily)
MSQSERAVVERAKSGDLDALNRVVSLHEQTVARFVTSRVRSAADAADVCQAVLCRACLKLATFRGGSSVRTWMLSIARRAVADFHRGDRSSLFLSLEALDGELDQSPYSVGAPGDRVHRLCDACWRIELCVACLMKTLPVEAQLAVILCDIYGFTDQEASRLLNRKLGSLRRLLRTTRATLDSVSGGSCALVRKTVYDSLGQVISGHKFWSDGTAVAGQLFDYSFDTIGNRTKTLAGGDQNGLNQRSSTYTPNSLNQYTQRTVPGNVDVLGVSFATNTVTVNGNTAYRKGE